MRIKKKKGQIPVKTQGGIVKTQPYNDAGWDAETRMCSVGPKEGDRKSAGWLRDSQQQKEDIDTEPHGEKERPVRNSKENKSRNRSE